MTPLGKFLRVRSGLRVGMRIPDPEPSYPQWLAGEYERRARRKVYLRVGAIVFAVLFAALVWMGWP